MEETKEIENSGPFRTITEIIKKKYPWIRDIRLTADWNNYTMNYFLDIYIDSDKFCEMLGCEPHKYRLRADFVYPNLNLLFNCSKEELFELQENIQKYTEHTQKGLKSLGVIFDRKITISGFSVE